MACKNDARARIIGSDQSQPGNEMVGYERWQEIRRQHSEDGESISAIARRMQLDRKTVRRCIRDKRYQGYRRERPAVTLLTAHEAWIEERAPEVNFSAQILYQVLRAERGYQGSYETVKRYMAPRRQEVTSDALTQRRFETRPGQQSQIDWGEARVRLGGRPVRMMIFVLTLGFSRRGFYWGYANQQISQFLDAHERAFEHFGGLTQEHLYDRPRTVCHPDRGGKRVWNSTFRAFADHWGFEPRLCRPYRAQTKGKVESGVKYCKGNFLPGRTFHDIDDFNEQLTHWNQTVADERIHGTTHEVPMRRFARERSHLLPAHGHPSFLTDATVSRIVARDWLVSFRRNRYSVPFRLIGQTVEVRAHDGQVLITHRGQLVASHRQLTGRHELFIAPEHGPGAVARNQRIRFAQRHQERPDPMAVEVEVRDLALYDSLTEVSP